MLNRSEAEVAKVEIYTRGGCGYCTSAKRLLASKGVDFIEYDGSDPERRKEMIKRSFGGYTYPQVFINGEPVGGSDDIHDLDADGALDPLLQAPEAGEGKPS